MSDHRLDPSQSHPYEALTPDRVLDAVETTGLVTDGRLLALNSYENRVWQVGLEEAEPIVAKFYRPGRWSDEAIIEEHEFSAELAAAGLSVVPPLRFGGRSLLDHADFRFALFPRQGGHAPEPAHEDTLRALGRALGRMHAVGQVRPFQHRASLSIADMGAGACAALLAGQWLPAHLERAFETLVADLLAHVESAWDRAGHVPGIRLHGDCHPGNILWRNGPHFVDFDDCRTGPAIQDLWMLISGPREAREVQLGQLLEGYRLFMDFEPRQLHLLEPLRALRMLDYQAWLARRWDDPAFPRAFPWFADERHWETVIGQLREQLSELQEPPLALGRT